MRSNGTSPITVKRGEAILTHALAPVRTELKRVLARVLATLEDPVARSVVYLITAGGKRLRPALVLLAGAAGPAPNQHALRETAAAVELIHTATLIHDDIIDRSALRRSQPSFHARWGTERAVLMGDYLYATAFRLLAPLQAPQVMEVMAEVCQQLCRGELREVEARCRMDLTEAEYLDIIRDKTASLIGGCCRSGAALGGCSPETIQRFTEFGISFGLAFQIIDDCLDLTGDARQLGKPILADLDRGALSLPIIYAAQMLPPRQRTRLLEPLRSLTQAGARAARSSVALARVAEMARSCGAIARAHARAQALAQSAVAALAETPMNGLTETYRMLSDYAVSRRS